MPDSLQAYPIDKLNWVILNNGRKYIHLPCSLESAKKFSVVYLNDLNQKTTALDIQLEQYILRNNLKGHKM